MSGRAEHYSDKCEHGFYMERCRSQDAASERSALERAAQICENLARTRDETAAAIRALASPAAAPARSGRRCAQPYGETGRCLGEALPGSSFCGPHDKKPADAPAAVPMMSGDGQCVGYSPVAPSLLPRVLAALENPESPGEVADVAAELRRYIANGDAGTQPRNALRARVLIGTDKILHLYTLDDGTPLRAWLEGPRLSDAGFNDGDEVLIAKLQARTAARSGEGEVET